MTALLALETRRARRHADRARRTTPAPAESVVGLRAGRADDASRDLAARAAAASANDAAATLASGDQRLGPGVRRRDERARHGARPARHDATRTRSASTRRTTARPRATSCRLALVLRRNEFFRETVDRPRATLDQRRAPARRSLNRNRLVRDHAFVDGVKTGRTHAGRLRPRRLGDARRRHRRQRGARRAERGRARRRHARAAALRPRAATAARRSSSAAPSLAQADLKYRDEQVDLVAGRGRAARPAARRARAGARHRRARRRSRARSPRARASARSRSACAAAPSRARRSSPRPRSTRRRWPSAWPTCCSRPGVAAARRRCSLPVPCRSCCCDGASSGERGASGDHHGHAQRGDRQDPVGAELPPGPAPPHRRADHDGRRQGRQRRPLAQVARPAGDRDRASRAGRPGTRIVEQLTDESILNDFVRIREESRTNTAVLDPTTGEQTEINERGPAITRARSSSSSATSSSTWRRARRSSSSPGSLPRGVDADYYAELDPRAAQARRDHDRRHRRRAAAPRGARRADGHLAERQRGRGARRPRVQRRGRHGPRRPRDGRARARARRS